MNWRISIIGLAVFVVAAAGWWVFQAGAANRGPSTETGALPNVPMQGRLSAGQAMPSDGDASAEVRELQQRLAVEQQARKRAEAEADVLRRASEPLRKEVVVSYGKVEDIGRQAGFIFPLLSEMRSLAARDPATLSPAEKSRLLDLQRRYADMLGVLPEIAGFQNNPEEYGNFFRHMTQQAADLSNAQADQVDLFMQQRAREMIRSGLNAGSKPADQAQQDTWEEQRDQFNEQTADGLRQLLSPALADKAGIDPQLMEFLETDFDKTSQSGFILKP